MYMKPSILLLFGGESSEHDVSIKSAINVSRAIDTSKYMIHFGYIDRDGVWWHVDAVVDNPTGETKQLLPKLGEAAFVIEGTDKLIRPTVILPILHGRNGEDGSVQALAQLLHIPIVGCDMTSSAAAMNKYITKQIAMVNNIKVASFMVHHSADPIPQYEKISEQLGATLFIKPANAGSSIGVHKVVDQPQLEQALRDAHTHDTIVLIEQAINARELEVAVLGNYPTVEASAVSEVRSDGDFYSYESKYGKASTSKVVIPAELSPEISASLQLQAKQIFYLLGGSGLARVDFFLDKDTQDIYLNEVNTIPGFTDISVYPKAWEHAGVSYGQLIERLINLAVHTSAV